MADGRADGRRVTHDDLGALLIKGNADLVDLAGRGRLPHGVATSAPAAW
ncbi:hypothetical protein [Micromonospora wenchangensis]